MAGIDAAYINSVNAGTDDAQRLAAILPYVGIDHWYTLARACGFAALSFAYLSLASSLVAGLRRDPLRLPSWFGTFHRQSGVLTILLVAAHAFLPYRSAFPPYQGWSTATVPFGQPDSWGRGATFWETFGIAAFYLFVLSGPTWFVLRGRPALWKLVHRFSAIAYPLAAAHALLLGTDLLVSGPARVGFLFAQVPLAVLLAARWAPSATPVRKLRWAPSILFGTAGVILLAVAVLDAAGVAATGMNL